MTDITLTQEQLNAILAAFGCTPPTNETPQKELRFTVNLSAALRIGMYGSEAPTASFIYVVNGQDVAFAYTGTGAETVVWNFGDGGNGTVQFNPTHTYVGSGPFTVTLTACNPMGCTTTSQVINLVTPTASFTYTTDGLEVTFTDTSTGATSWSWDFGDGSPADTTQNPVHTYSGHGSYNVTLTINAGADSDMQAVSVNTAFHAAVIAAGATRFYDYQEASGTTAVNSGSAGASANGTYTSVGLGVTGVNGTNDAGFVNSGTDRIAVPAFSVSSFTIGVLLKPNGALAYGGIVQLTGSGGGEIGIYCTDSAGAINAYVLNTSGGFVDFNTDTGVVSADTPIAIYLCYDHVTGAGKVRIGTSPTLTTPTFASQSTPASPAGGLGSLNLTGGGIFGLISADGTDIDAFFIAPSVLTDEQLGVINSAINWP